ncbi:hypothetical protein NDU88_002308 [Pleurodeles waltl]|uniref:Uncharacterized protein n=1 Tax=Pleurodeles waltl TaxID=8319 RepID=A0AAV7NG01_PLEWA|nr:hypothetical protein NDU88_002308 [Pleurodeles waltl]
MLPKMRREAAKRGKEWLQQKMAEEIEEGHSEYQTGKGTSVQEEARCLGTEQDIMQRPRKQQKVDSKSAKAGYQERARSENAACSHHEAGRTHQQ